MKRYKYYMVLEDVYLLLGSNQGDRLDFLDRANELIELRLGPVEGKSSLYKTRAWGRTDLDDFLNQVIFFKSNITAQEILRTTQNIEMELGRVRKEKWGSRTIDIDILFYGNEVINEPDLIIPHPLFQERRFAVEPMLEIAPDFVHPVFNKKVSALAVELKDDLSVEKI